MKIGIKYCGGCNPTYEREKIEKTIRKNFNAEIVYTSSLENVDVLVFINGCKHACAIESIGSPESRRVVLFDELKDELELINEIKSALKR
ncbi:MAG: hypothetical protein H0Z28_06520 [Archaeoglobus sp.]|nr:hypothetical protein [Archaeoglobus sp.]